MRFDRSGVRQSLVRLGSSLKMGAAIIVAVAGLAASANAATIGPGQSLEASFTTVVNSADMLQWFDNTPLTTTGSPIISVSLFNGGSLLGTYTQTSSQFFVVGFESPGGLFTVPLFNGPPPTRVDFSSFNDGSIVGRLVLTVTGGTITFNINDLILTAAASASSNSYSSQNDLRNITYTASSVPEPDSAALLLLGIVLLLVMRRRLNAPASVRPPSAPSIS